MFVKRLVIISLIIIALVLIPVIVIMIITEIKKKKEKLLPDGNSLIKSPQFYKNHYNDTLKYLTAVYPTAETSFKAMDPIELAKFYNSLWYYYNCEASFDQNFGEFGTYDKYVKHCWQALPGCGTKWPKLPYTPQGYLYSFRDWLNNMWTPWINSKSDKPPSYFTAATPAITIWSWFTGPAPIFMPQRVIVRQVYAPESPKLVTWNDAYNPKVKYSYNRPSLTPGHLGKFKSYWNYPKKWWLGSKNNTYIEVTYSDIMEIGSGAMVWWNGMPGSGVFLNVGKCKRARNKADGAFQLAKEMALTDKGRTKLKEWFFSSDPYDIIAGLLTFPCRETGAWVWDPVNKKKVQLNFCSGAGNPFMGLPTYANGWNNVLTIKGIDWYRWCGQKPANTNRPWAYGVPNECIDAITTGSKYPADRIAAQGPFDEAMTCMGLWLGYDTLQLTQSANGSGFWQIEMLELRGFPPEARERDYSTFLEVMNAISKSGLCKSFSDEADGFIPGEGAGVILLKRLNAAVTDSDDIIAIIRGGAINNSGTHAGLTIPSESAQA